MFGNFVRKFKIFINLKLCTKFKNFNLINFILILQNLPLSPILLVFYFKKRATFRLLQYAQNNFGYIYNYIHIDK